MDFMNPKKPIKKVAILMPINNGVEYFDESFISILLQTRKHWQLWIGINGHPKGSLTYEKVLATVKPFAIHNNIVLLDFGLPGNKSATLNRMVKMLPKDIEYVALLDVDDVWYPKKLEIQMALLESHMSPPPHIIGTKCKYFGETIKDDIIPYVPIGDFTKTHDFKQGNPIINSSVIIHTPLAYWNETETNCLLEDYELWLELRKKGNVRFYNCDEVLVKHRLHTDSAFNGKNTGRVNELLSRY
jgi:teichuronic acid biosynthesis glycosyltransferase TuaG